MVSRSHVITNCPRVYCRPKESSSSGSRMIVTRMAPQAVAVAEPLASSRLGVTWSVIRRGSVDAYGRRVRSKWRGDEWAGEAPADPAGLYASHRPATGRPGGLARRTAKIGGQPRNYRKSTPREAPSRRRTSRIPADTFFCVPRLAGCHLAPPAAKAAGGRYCWRWAAVPSAPLAELCAPSRLGVTWAVLRRWSVDEYGRRVRSKWRGDEWDGEAPAKPDL